MVIYCQDCQAEILDAVEDSPNHFCFDCLGLEYVGDAVFAIDPEAEGTDDYIGEIVIAKVTKKAPFVVQVSAQWRDDEGMDDEDDMPLEPVYLTRTAAQKLITLLKKALAADAKAPKAAKARRSRRPSALLPVPTGVKVMGTGVLPRT